MEGVYIDLNLSKAERDLLQKDLYAAVPYEENDPILNTLDGDVEDLGRWCATMAKKLLEQDVREKAVAGRPLEPERTPESDRRNSTKG